MWIFLRIFGPLPKAVVKMLPRSVRKTVKAVRYENSTDAHQMILLIILEAISTSFAFWMRVRRCVVRFEVPGWENVDTAFAVGVRLQVLIFGRS